MRMFSPPTMAAGGTAEASEANSGMNIHCFWTGTERSLSCRRAIRLRLRNRKMVAVSRTARRFIRALVSLGAAWAALVPVYALDPSLSLTQYIHRIWQVTQGLPQAAIYSIWQTHDGYLWLGTPTGLVRFDGVRFTSFDDPTVPGLKNAWVGNLLEDRQNNLWIGSNDAG